MSAAVPPTPAAVFVGDDDDDDDKPTLGGSLGAFPPVYSAAPLPLLLQNKLASYRQCHCRQCRHFPSKCGRNVTTPRHRHPFPPVYSAAPPPPPPM
ncbi:MAG: hypothetical protein J0L63_05905 [Anaerolineae bacterium]|nr:hypothetical protein [Anaerolineae bacterium]